jgi:NAD(P)-dependent dehydrogenase (short-subunit alcohol dehydrogenase family)
LTASANTKPGHFFEGENMKKIIVITGASKGFGPVAARELAKAGHTVYACISDTKARYTSQAREAKKFAFQNEVDLRTAHLEGSSHESADTMVQRIMAECGRLDVVIHNSSHVVFGPTEAFTIEQLAQLYDISVLSTQRVNRAVLPILREQGQGLVMWVGGYSIPGETPPYLGPYFAVKAGVDALAVSYAAELARWNIETTIIIPGALLASADDLAHPESPKDSLRLKEYMSGPTAGLAKQVMKGVGWSAAVDAGASQIAEAIVTVVDMPFGSRPFRVHVDPTGNRTEIVNHMADRARADMFREMGLGDLLNPSSAGPVEIYS